MILEYSLVRLFCSSCSDQQTKMRGVVKLTVDQKDDPAKSIVPHSRNLYHIPF